MDTSMPIDEMGLSVCAYNVLRRAHINTLGDITALLDKGGIPALMRVRNIGQKCVIEILKATRRVGVNIEKYLDAYLSALQNNPETSAASLSKWEKMRTDVVDIPYEQSTRSPSQPGQPLRRNVTSRLSDNPILNRKVRYNTSSVVCPVCRKLLPSDNRLVYIPGEGTPNIRVGLCVTCKSFYSFSSKLIGKEGSCESIPVKWTELRYQNGTGQNLQFKKSVIRNHPIRQEKPSGGVGKQIPEARKKNVAAERPEYNIVLAKLPVNKSPSGSCPICKRTANGSVPVEFKIYKDGEAVSRFAFTAKCVRCNIVFVDERQEYIIRSQNPGYQILTIDATKFHNGSELMLSASDQAEADKTAVARKVSLPFDDKNPEKINLSEARAVVYVYAKKCHCANCEKKYGMDTIRNRTVVLYTVAGRVVESNVMYCAGCGRYFMNYASFSQLQNDYGGVLMEYKYIGELAQKFISNMNFAPDSILSRCGYSVQAGISAEYRQSVLRYILETGKASKYEIVELITGFISLREYNPMMDGACSRWREDLAFVNHYKVDEQKKLYNPIFVKGK